ncbi:MAG: hypothetical protein ACO2OX_00490 [Candidatus Nanopusillus sp.]
MTDFNFQENTNIRNFINNFDNFLEEISKRVSERSLANLIVNFGKDVQKLNRFFPDSSSLYQEYPYDLLVMIPKHYANRYCRMWTSLFPARVSYIINQVKNLVIQTGLEQTFSNIIQTYTKNQNLQSIDTLLIPEIILKLIKKTEEILKEKQKKEQDEYSKKITKLREYLKELKENYIFGPIDKVFIRNISYGFPERFGIFISANSTIPYIEFWGSNLYQVSITMMLPNTINVNGKIMMIYQYFDRLRGTKLIQKYSALFLEYEDLILTIYPISFATGDEAESSGLIARMDGFLTRILYSPFDPSKINNIIPVDDPIRYISRNSQKDLYENLVNKKKFIEIISEGFDIHMLTEEERKRLEPSLEIENPSKFV